jgi:phosphatidate phosphatase APP1
MIRNTFYLPFQEVPGMAEAYQAWARQGAVFFYLSASPWQLYPELSSFMRQSGFPFGSFRLRHFRIKDRSVVRFLRSSKNYKTDTIVNLLKRFPKRRFVLVGDSGEKDPEVYGEIARAHQDRILHIFIRKVPSSDLSAERLAAAFEGIPRDCWTLFDDPAVLARLPVGK